MNWDYTGRLQKAQMDIPECPPTWTSGWESEATSGLFGSQQDAGAGNAASGVMRVIWGERGIWKQVRLRGRRDRDSGGDRPWDQLLIAAVSVGIYY